VQSGRALLDGEPMTGHWFERTREYAARNQGLPFEPLRFATEEAVTLSPIPCWAHLPPDLYRARVAALVESIKEAAALRTWHLWSGTPLEGHWFDRTQEFAARLRREDIGPMRYVTVETVTLSPIPCWAHLPPELYRARIAALVETIETEAACERERTGVSVLGVKAILSRDPQYRPPTLARSPAPRVHAATKAARKAFYEIYAAFVSAFREASERLRRGDHEAPFPHGSFPPALPFVAG
jgi:hypothetical protein